MIGTEELVEEAIEQKRYLAPYNEAFTELVRRFQDMVFGYALSIMHDVHLAEDIVQEAFIRAYEQLEGLRDPAVFPAWIRKITARECLKELRSRRTDRLPEDYADRLESGYEDPQRRYESEETRNEVMQVIEALPPEQQTSIVLYYIDGYSQSEISRFLNVELSTVKKRIQRGRDTMRKEFMKKVRDDLGRVKPSRDGKLLEKITLYTSFDMAAKLGQITILEQMLVDGIDINEQDAAGRTLLHWAVENEHIDAAELLLKSGADPGIFDKRGRTPSQIAEKKRNADLAAMFRGGRFAPHE